MMILYTNHNIHNNNSNNATNEKKDTIKQLIRTSEKN